MPDSHFLAGQKRRGERKRDTAEKVRGLEWHRMKRSGQISWSWTHKYNKLLCQLLSYLSIDFLLSQYIYLSTVSLYKRSSLICVISIHAYPCVVLPQLQLSLFSSTTWCSSMYRSLRVSDSVALSSNTCCWRSASLLSDDAESSPPSILPFRPTLPVFLSPPSSHTFVHFSWLFLFWGEHKRSLLSISCSPSQCFPFVHFPSPSPPLLFSLVLSMTESCPSKLWVLLCLLPQWVR